MTVSPLPQVHVDAIDGVPILWVDAPPPFAMTLTFRVGQADEVLPSAGITHLVEHMAFPHDHRDGVANNGRTGLLTTQFYAWGDPREAAEFLARVTRGLQRPDLGRLDQQRSIIATEEARWAVTPRGELLIARYGAHGPGLAGFPGYGVGQVTSDDVAAWASRYFTRGNAIAWMTGPPPPGLAFDLPDGPAMPPPRPAVRPGPFPRWTPKPQPFVAIGVAGPADAPLGAAARILTRRLFATLRDGDAVSYDVQTIDDLVDSKTAHHMIVADCLADAAPHVTDRLIAAADGFVERGPTAQERDDELGRIDRAFRDDPRAVIGWMNYAAESTLCGIDVDELEEDLERRRSWARTELRDAWAAAAAELTLCVPGTVQVTDPRFNLPTSPMPPNGRTFHESGRRPFQSAAKAVLAEDAISLVDREGGYATIAFRETAALLRAGGGARVLIHEDGSELRLDAGWYRSGDELIAGIDAAIPAERQVRLGPG